MVITINVTHGITSHIMGDIFMVLRGVIPSGNMW